MASTKKVLIPVGKRGRKGQDGANGIDITNVNLSKIDNPILHVFLNNKIAETIKGSLTFDTDPDSDLFFTDRYGIGGWIFPQTLTNHIEYSHNTGQWQDLLGNWTLIIANTTDPDGGSQSNDLRLDSDTRAASRVLTFTLDTTGAPNDKNWAITFWYKVTSGVIDSFDIRFDGVDYIVTTDTTTDSIWKKVTFITPARSGTPTSLNAINPRGDASSRFEITFVSVSPNNAEIPLTKTLNAAVSFANSNYYLRENNLGWYIDGANSNLALNSQDLTRSAWSVVNGSVSIQPYAGLSPENTANENVLVVANTTSDITLRCTNAALANATNYTVSFYVLVVQGSHQGINVNVGGGVNVTTSEFADSVAIKRVTAEVLSSSGGYIDINIIAPINGFQLMLWGVQCETGGLSSYIRSGDIAVSHIADTVSLPFDNNAPYGADPWSFVTEQYGVNAKNSGKLYEVDPTFLAEYSNGDLVVTNGTMVLTLTDAYQSTDIAITFDGVTMRGYLNGAEVATTSTGVSTTITAINLLLAEALNASMKNTKFYASQLNADEVLYLAGIY